MKNSVGYIHCSPDGRRYSLIVQLTKDLIRNSRRVPRTVTAVTLDPADETCREYERVVDVNYLDQIRLEAKQFSTKRLARQSGVAECAIQHFEKRKKTIKPPALRKLIKAMHNLENTGIKD